MSLPVVSRAQRWLALCFAFSALGCAASAGGDGDPGSMGGSGGGPGGASGGGPSGGGAGGGSPGSGGSAGGAPAPVGPASPAVAISEIMYHPVLENSDVDHHEFVELYNTTSKEQSLRDYRLLIGKKEAFKFPATAVIGAGKYLVLAKNKAMLVALYGLRAEETLGDYEGELDNGGETVTLLDAKGEVVDVVRYDDKFPWPVGADALGAGSAWFPATFGYDKQQYKGRSLERYSFAVAATDVRNWEASALGGGTPGRANSVSGDPPAIVTELAAPVVKKGDKIKVTAKLSAGPVSEVAVEYFADDLTKADDTEPKMRVMMMAAADVYTAELPVLPDRSIVRYRVVGKRGNQMAGPISPRPTDPFAFHLSFVQPDPPLPDRSYQIFIAPANWTKMWTNLSQGPNSGCELSPLWDARVPAVLVYGGRAYDVLARHQGSRYQRRNGYRLPNWPTGTGPTGTDFKTYSWRLSFPNYSLFVAENGDARDTVTLNKQYQACPGVLNLLESKLYWAAGVRTQRMRFARLFINGTYYHYMMDVESIDEDLLAKTEKNAPPGASVGDLFKADGAVDDNQGPWGRGNFAPMGLNSTCPQRWTKLDRYRYTYERQSHEWKSAMPAGHDELIKIIEDLRPLYDAAKASNNWQPVRAHFEKYFDVPQLLTHWTIRNVVGVWDDGVHNVYPYKRPSDGKWEAYPQDFDLDFGGDTITRDGTTLRWAQFAKPSGMSIFTGEEGAGNDPAGGINWLKSALIRAFRQEFRARMVELMGTVLKPENVWKLLDESMAEWDQKAWDDSPAMGKCEVTARVNGARTWLMSRYMYLASQGVR